MFFDNIPNSIPSWLSDDTLNIIGSVMYFTWGTLEALEYRRFQKEVFGIDDSDDGPGRQGMLWLFFQIGFWPFLSLRMLWYDFINWLRRKK